MFQDFVEYVAAIKTAGETIYSEGRGTVGKLKNCLYVPSMDVNLISLGHAAEQIPNLKIAQRAGLCIIRDLQNRNADKVFRTEDRLCEIEDLTWMGVPDYTRVIMRIYMMILTIKRYIIYNMSHWMVLRIR